MTVTQWMRARLKSGRAIGLVDRVLVRAKPAPAAGEHLLLAPPGRGNIGDQALVEAFVEGAAGRVTVLVRDTADFTVPPHLADRMTLLPLPALVYGTVFGHARDVRALARAAATASTFSVLGADIMDGAYVPHASVNRAQLATRFAELGWPTRIVGFSWNAAPHADALRAVRRAGEAGVQLLLRDPLSAERARADGLRVIDTADIVFTAQTRDDGVALRLVPDLGDAPLALVNASGLVGDRMAAYQDAIATLRRAGYRVLVVPHVSRPGADDLPLCQALVEQAQDEGVTLVSGLLSPGEIRGLAARAALVVTGRMHLAVMSLMAHTPAITVATQGKVEGLMAMFETPILCVAPDAAFADSLAAALGTVIADRDEISARIAAALPQVTARAEANLVGLGGATSPNGASDAPRAGVSA